MDFYVQQYPWVRELMAGCMDVSWKHVLLWGIGFLSIWIAAWGGHRARLLAPLGIGMVLANIPHSAAISMIPGEEGFLLTLYQSAVLNQLLPLLLLLGAGLNSHIGWVMRRPIYFFWAVLSQMGIFIAALGAAWAGFSLGHSASIGIMSSGDIMGTLYIGSRYGKELLGFFAFGACIYMIVAPLIQPILGRLVLSDREEEGLAEESDGQKESFLPVLIFSLLTVGITGVLAPASAALVGSFMAGTVLKTSGWVEKWEWGNGRGIGFWLYLLTGVSIGAAMPAEKVLTMDAAVLLMFGFLAFAIHTVWAVILGRVLNKGMKKKIEPLLGIYLVGGVFAMDTGQNDSGNNKKESIEAACVAGRLAAVLTAGVLVTLVSALSK